MLSLEEFLKSIGPLAETLSKEQIIKLREDQDQLAEIFFDSWLAEINKNNV